MISGECGAVCEMWAHVAWFVTAGFLFYLWWAGGQDGGHW